VTPFPAGEYAVTRVTVGDKAPECGGNVQKHADWNPDKKEVFSLSGKTKIAPALFESTVTVKMADGSARAFAELEQAARDKTFTELTAGGRGPRVLCPARPDPLGEACGWLVGRRAGVRPRRAEPSQGPAPLRFGARWRTCRGRSRPSS
jgi:hypothetical protein